MKVTRIADPSPLGPLAAPKLLAAYHLGHSWVILNYDLKVYWRRIFLGAAFQDPLELLGQLKKSIQTLADEIGPQRCQECHRELGLLQDYFQQLAASGDGAATENDVDSAFFASISCFHLGFSARRARERDSALRPWGRLGEVVGNLQVALANPGSAAPEVSRRGEEAESEPYDLSEFFSRPETVEDLLDAVRELPADIVAIVPVLRKARELAARPGPPGAVEVLQCLVGRAVRHKSGDPVPETAFGYLHRAVPELHLRIVRDLEDYVNNWETRPQWDKRSGLLIFRGQTARHVKVASAKSLVRVLDAFQEQGWPQFIDATELIPGTSATHLKKWMDETSRYLNKSCKWVSFHVTGTQFMWRKKTNA